MTNEEMIAKYESMNSMEDAYALMQENGYSGTMQDFEALCAQAAEEMDAMDMDAMDAVAGGFGMDDVKNGAISAYNYVKDGLVSAWDYTSGAAVKGWNWVKANPGLTAEIAGGVALAAIGITAGVKYYRSRNTAAPEEDEEAYRARRAAWRENLLLTEEEEELD